MSEYRPMRREEVALRPEVDNGAMEAQELMRERANTSLKLLNNFKQRNESLVHRIMNKRESQIIGRAEVDIIIAELEAQKQELDALHTGRLKALQKVLESKLMYMNTTLQVDLSRAYKHHEAILMRTMNEAEQEFQHIIEDFASKIENYKLETMKKRALVDLEIQINCFYDAKEKLFQEYYNLIENQKFPEFGR